MIKVRTRYDVITIIPLPSELMKNETQKIKYQSKHLSWILRHGAAQEGLSMDCAGWVNIHKLLQKIDLNLQDLNRVIQRNNKARFEIKGDNIRACQGHSLEQLPVTQEGLESSWKLYKPKMSDIIWHATQACYLDSIQRDGVLRGKRSHVHLASTKESEVGKRNGAPILLKISVKCLRNQGQEVFMSSNGVILTRYVPPSCIFEVNDTRVNHNSSFTKAHVTNKL